MNMNPLAFSIAFVTLIIGLLTIKYSPNDTVTMCVFFVVAVVVLLPGIVDVVAVLCKLAVHVVNLIKRVFVKIIKGVHNR